MDRIFRNPANGHTETVSVESAYYVFYFGPFYLAYRGLWAHFFVWVLLVGAITGITGGPGLMFVLPLVIIAYCCTIKGILAKSYLRRGWEEVQTTAAGTIGQSIVAPKGLRECPYCAEMIKVQAIRCKHCNSDVEAIADHGASSQGLTSNSDTQQSPI